MHVVHKGRIADLAELRDGSVFLADFDDGPVVRAMKAFYVPQSGVRAGKVVTIGPFRDEDRGKPGIHEPNVVHQSSVVDLTGVFTFTFSIEPEHLTFRLPSPRECCGSVILIEDDAFLGCQFYQGDGSWEPAYLNMATGEIVFHADTSKACLSREWSLQNLA